MHERIHVILHLLYCLSLTFLKKHMNDADYIAVFQRILLPVAYEVITSCMYRPPPLTWTCPCRFPSSPSRLCTHSHIYFSPLCTLSDLHRAPRRLYTSSPMHLVPYAPRPLCTLFPMHIVPYAHCSLCTSSPIHLVPWPLSHPCTLGKSPCILLSEKYYRSKTVRIWYTQIIYNVKFALPKKMDSLYRKYSININRNTDWNIYRLIPCSRNPFLAFI